jgi:hypothetical protein
MEKDINPFLVSGYKDAAHFCNRKTETAALKLNIKNNRNTTLFAIRRLGKTGLIHHVFNSYSTNKKVVCIYIDILNTQNLKEFTNQLATAIYNRFPENKGIGKKIINTIKLLRPSVSYDTLSGEPELSFSLGEPKQYEKTIQLLFTFLDAQNINIIFAIDEFQQILEYPEKNTEALLRTHIQQLKHTNFIFCGSNQKMMHQLFNSAKRPFYGSCVNMHLDFIETKDYELFIIGLFKQYNKSISQEAVTFILEWTCCHTFYTQYFCNFLFATSLTKITLTDVKKNAIAILKINENTYFQYRNLITKAQWNLLLAIAKENKLYKAHSKQFINRYNLGTSSMVSRSMEALLEKEMIYFNAGVEKPYYEVYDKFLMRWIQYS